MSFQINKDENARIVKRNIPIGITSGSIFSTKPYLSSINAGLVNNKTFSPVLSTVTSNVSGSDENSTIVDSGTLNSAILNKLDGVVLGVASPGKAIVLNSSKDINGINQLKCNSINVNGVNIVTDVGDTSSAVVANDYFSNNVVGQATAGKALIANSNLEVTGIKKISGNIKDKTTLNENEYNRLIIDLNANFNLPDSNWKDLVYSIDLKKYLAVGTNYVATSATGNSWAGFAKPNMNFNRVSWESKYGKYFAICSEGLFSSTDGLDWNVELSEINLVDFAIGNSQILTFNNNTIFTKTNLDTTWTQTSMTAGMSSISWRQVIFASGKILSPRFVIVGVNNICSCLEANVTTNTSWTITAVSGTWSSVAYGNDTFIAVNSNSTATNKFITSINGTNWSLTGLSMKSPETGFDTMPIISVKYINYLDIFILIPEFSRKRLIYTKTGQELYFVSYEANGFISSLDFSPIDNKIVAITSGANTTFNSRTNLYLTPLPVYSKPFRNDLGFYSTFHSFFSFNQIVFAINTSGLTYSTDGITFNKCILARNGGNAFDQISIAVRCITYSNALNKYFACGDPISADGILNAYVSNDGITWTNFTIGSNTVSLSFIEWSESHNRLYAVGNNLLYFSTDGIVWNSQSYIGGTVISKVILDENETILLHGFNAGNRLHRLNSDLSYTGLNTTLFRRIIAFNNELYTSSGATVLRSINGGIEWTTVYTAPANIVDIVHNKKINCIVGYTNSSVFTFSVSNGWSALTMPFGITVSVSMSYLSYSEHFESIYSCSIGVNIQRTLPLKSQSLITGPVYGNRIWKALPDKFNHDRELDDSIITGFKYNNILRSISHLAAQPIRDIYYSRHLNRWFVFRTYTSSFTAAPTESSTEFITTISTNTYHMCLDTHNGCVQLRGSTFSSGSFTGVSHVNSYFDRFTNLTTNYTATETATYSGNFTTMWKYSKEMKSLYYASGTDYIMVHLNRTNTTSNIVFESVSVSGMSGATCIFVEKEINIGVALGTLSSQPTAFLIDFNRNHALSSTTLPAGTYLNVEYHYEAKLFIIHSTNAIYYSQNGSTWVQSPTTQLSSYTYGLRAMKYIPELNVMGITTTNMFAFTRNGIDWTVIPTNTNGLWVSFDYNSFSGVICLISSDGNILMTSHIQSLITNTLTPSSGYTENDKYFLYTNARIYKTNPLTMDYTLNMDNGIHTLMPNNSNFKIFNNTSNDLEITASVPLNVTKTLSNSSSPILLNNKSFNMNENSINSIRHNLWLTNFSNGDYRNNRFKLVEEGGSLSLNSISAQSINITNNALTNSSYGGTGLVVADSERNIKIDKIGATSININNTVIRNTIPLSDIPSIPHSAPFFEFGKYLNFKNTDFMLGNTQAVIIGSDYSPTLDIIVVYASAVSNIITQGIYVSNDKGKNWTIIGIPSGTFSAMNITEHSCRIKWFPSANTFCIVRNNNILLSKNGYNWSSITNTIGTSGSLGWDSKLSRPFILSGTGIWYPEVSNNLFGNWINVATTPALSTLEYHQPTDLYFYRELSTRTIIRSTSDPYVVTITSTAPAAVASDIIDIISWNDMIYYTSGATVLRRNVGGTTAGTVVLTLTGLSIRKLVVISQFNVLMAFCSTGYAYTTNGTNWSFVLISNTNAIGNNVTTEGMTDNIVWAGDRLIYVRSEVGALVSNLEDKYYKMSNMYLDNLVKNKLSHNRLLAVNKNSDIIIRHSNTPVNMFATAYGNGWFVTTGTNSNVVMDSLKKNQTIETHSGAWVDVAYYSVSNQFIKVGNNIMSVSSALTPNSWTEITPPSGNWTNIILDVSRSKVYIFARETNNCMVASINASGLSPSTIWSAFTLSTSIPSWNGLEIIGNRMFSLGANFISYIDLNNNSAEWVNNRVLGVWNDIAFGKDLYIVAGDGFVARSRNLTHWSKTFIPKNYHRVIYVRLLSEFYLMNNQINYFSDNSRQEQTNSVVKTGDGKYFMNSFHAYLHGAGSTTPTPYRLSNIYYFEETDQFTFPLNNSGNKYYVYTQNYAVNKENYKISTPQAFTTNGSAIEIARGNAGMVAPLNFNVFQDSAAKPATSTWITTSDERLKENIVQADLDICYNNVKNLELKRYKWKDEYINTNISEDRRKLGWIAQDVEQVIPKAVQRKNMFGIEDCRLLDSDQIIANMFGAVKKLCNKLKEKELAIE